MKAFSLNQIFLFFMMLIVSSGQNVQTVDSSLQNHLVFLPMVINKYPITEIDNPNCRYSKSPGSDQYIIYYRWDNNTLANPNDAWRIAASQGIADWDNSATKFTWVEYPWGGNIKLINTSDPVRGVTTWWCGMFGNAVDFEIEYNLYHDINDQYTDNMRKGIASHEIGHAHFIGHIPNDSGWEGLMLKYASLPFFDTHFSPMYTDTILINQIYK